VTEKNFSEVRAVIPDLQTLITPLTEAGFLTALRERKRTFLPGCEPRRFESLLNWQTLNHLLEAAAFPLHHLRVLRESTPIPQSLYIKQDRVSSRALYNLLNQGVSLIFNRLEEQVPALRVLCNNIASQTSEHIRAAAIVTSGRGGALECHYDDQDLIILQIAGTKRWHVFGASSIPGRSPEGSPVFDRVLKPGDLLFLPAREWHHCENGPGRSLHLSILFDPPDAQCILAMLASQLVSDEIFRRPLTRHSSAEDAATHEAALKAHLVEMIRSISLAQLMKDRAASNTVDRIHLEGQADLALADRP
jgi:ribosomal protein L16 Arg81 hydroxylase